MSKRNLIVILSLVTALVMVFLVIKPLWQSIVGLKNEVAEKELEIAKLNQLLAKVEQLKAVYQANQPVLEKVKLSLPEEEDLPFLILQLEDMAASNGLVLESVSFRPGTSRRPLTGQASDQLVGQPPQIMLISLKVFGPYQGLKGFLENTEKSIRALEINSLNLGMTSLTGQASDLFESDLELSVYYQ